MSDSSDAKPFPLSRLVWDLDLFCAGLTACWTAALILCLTASFINTRKVLICSLESPAAALRQSLHHFFPIRAGFSQAEHHLVFLATFLLCCRDSPVPFEDSASGRVTAELFYKNKINTKHTP
ncbi:hypothetical protein FKM82_027304 [Ascaphus truei]